MPIIDGYLTTAELAALIGVSRRRVYQLADSRGFKPAKIVGRTWLWHKSAARALKPRRPGRPRNER